jgi:hypothetical protein
MANNNFGVNFGVVGQSSYSDGQNAAFRMDRLGALVIADRIQDAVLRGNCWAAQTAATGVAPGTAVGTTAAFSLFNPAGSGKKLIVLRASMGYISGTLGAGTVHYLMNKPTDAAATGTAISAVNLGTGTLDGSVGKALTTATITAPTPIGPFCSLGASLATTAIAPWQIFDDLNGRICVAPGCTLSLHATAAAGSTPVVVFGAIWEEVSNS